MLLFKENASAREYIQFYYQSRKKPIIFLATVLLQLVFQGRDPRVDKVSDRNFKKGLGNRLRCQSSWSYGSFSGRYGAYLKK